MTTAITVPESFVVDEELATNKEKAYQQSKIEFLTSCIRNAIKTIPFK